MKTELDDANKKLQDQMNTVSINAGKNITAIVASLAIEIWNIRENTLKQSLFMKYIFKDILG